MGSGSWDVSSYASYTTTTKGVSLDHFTTATNYTAQSIFKCHSVAPVLNPKNVMRECCDSEEHPNSLPIILALDVTGSMGGAAVKVAQKLNEIMTDLYADEQVQDPEFCIMAIGDVIYDDAPIQISQFESDIRIAEQLDQIYFEGGGGGNNSESYSAAWYMGLNHCKLDCWNRGQKGIIITLGDEFPNPYLPRGMGSIVGEHDLQANIETSDLLKEAQEKFEIYHIAVDDPETSFKWFKSRGAEKEWKKLLGEDHFYVANLDQLAPVIVDIILKHGNNITAIPYTPAIGVNENGEVTW